MIKKGSWMVFLFLGVFSLRLGFVDLLFTTQEPLPQSTGIQLSVQPEMPIHGADWIKSDSHRSFVFLDAEEENLEMEVEKLTKNIKYPSLILASESFLTEPIGGFTVYPACHELVSGKPDRTYLSVSALRI